MDKDNVLKKEFKKKDVERMRNIIKGQSGERTGAGVGYAETKKTYKEGDIWDENGRKWTIKDGIKQNITKLDIAKKYSVPLFCPTCSTIMNKTLDADYYKSYGGCMDCIAKKETKLKLEGKWEDHVKDIHNKEIDKLIEEYKLFMKEQLEETNDGFIAENGDIESWNGGINLEKAQHAMEESIKYLEAMKK